MKLYVIICDNSNDNDLYHNKDAASVPSVGDRVYLENGKSGVVTGRAVEYRHDTEVWSVGIKVEKGGEE